MKQFITVSLGGKHNIVGEKLLMVCIFCISGPKFANLHFMCSFPVLTYTILTFKSITYPSRPPYQRTNPPNIITHLIISFIRYYVHDSPRVLQYILKNYPQDLTSINFILKCHIADTFFLFKTLSYLYSCRLLLFIVFPQSRQRNVYIYDTFPPWPPQYCIIESQLQKYVFCNGFVKFIVISHVYKTNIFRPKKYL